LGAKLMRRRSTICSDAAPLGSSKRQPVACTRPSTIS
jgi:hypothetical protein